MTHSEKTKLFYGWWVVAACSLIVLLTAMSRYSLTIFMPTLEAELGWNRATLGFGMTVHLWVYACASLLVGILVDKFGSRFPMMIGGALISAGIFLLSGVGTTLEFQLFYGVILGLGVSFAYFVPGVAAARVWFQEKGALAIAITSLGSACGLAIVSFLIPAMIEAWGWRTAWLYLGLTAGALIMALSLVVKRSPAVMGLYPDGVSAQEHTERMAATESPAAPARDWTVKEALKTPSFWCVAMAYTAFNFPGMGLVAHVASWGFDIARQSGVAPASAKTAITAAMFALSILAVVGMLLGGALSDRFGKKPVSIVALVTGLLLCLAFTQVTSLFGFAVAMLLFGLIPSFFYPIWTALLGDMFGTKPLATLISIGIFVGAIIGGTGSYVYGWAFTTFGSYNIAFLISAGCFLFATVSILLARHNPQPVAGTRSAAKSMSIPASE
ncbi:MFS transporter [Desulfoluna spongiiphila]|uniref:MFS transporter n=1 Tax=Desulfoluna spongiiphila TaxID=419481 RepID=UPI001255C401|nr:MFS transporter [Desulfoluna spongiiphila]VVS93529.1 prokaryotic membrane lipoprotein lipid attachment site profile [Desulfoluna spongiiphila]